ncbi:MAG: YHS domain-containing protein [Anaerolineales bacterium]
MAIDPVCKMEVDEETAEWTSTYKGETYYFCAPGCKAAFDRDPEKFLSEQEGHSGHDHSAHH